MTDQQVLDPYAAAMAAKEAPPLFWGSLMTDAQFVVLEKGIGRLPFDPNSHPASRKVTAIDFSLLPISEMNMNLPIDRNCVAEFGEWLKIILPSLKELGVELRDLNDKFVKVKLVPTGRKYTNSSGETKDATNMKFLKVFADENECIADYLSGEPEPVDPQVEPAVQRKVAGVQAPTDTEKETAFTFLKVLVDNAVNGQTDLKVIQSTLKASLDSTPFVAKHFTVDSPETMTLIMAKMGK